MPPRCRTPSDTTPSRQSLLRGPRVATEGRVNGRLRTARSRDGSDEILAGGGVTPNSRARCGVPVGVVSVWSASTPEQSRTRTTRVYFPRSASCPHAQVELLRRVSPAPARGLRLRNRAFSTAVPTRARRPGTCPPARRGGCAPDGGCAAAVPRRRLRLDERPAASALRAAGRGTPLLLIHPGRRATSPSPGSREAANGRGDDRRRLPCGGRATRGGGPDPAPGTARRGCPATGRDLRASTPL